MSSVISQRKLCVCIPADIHCLEKQTMNSVSWKIFCKKKKEAKTQDYTFIQWLCCQSCLVVLKYAGILVHVCTKMSNPSHDHMENSTCHYEISYSCVSPAVMSL